jgi:hypothetical protein
MNTGAHHAFSTALIESFLLLGLTVPESMRTWNEALAFRQRSLPPRRASTRILHHQIPCTRSHSKRLRTLDFPAMGTYDTCLRNVADKVVMR